MPRSTILVIDDEPNILSTVRRSLELEGYAVEVAGGGAAGLAKLAEHDIDLVLLDVMMPGETGLEVLPKLRAAKPETIVVMMSGNATIETAVQATKAGAHDFIEKPLSGDKLLITVQNALGFARLRGENQRLRGRSLSDFAMIGKASAMRLILDKVAKTAPTTGRVLITGEIGAGRFREDLYYRLAVVPIELPPLRARREDIPALVEHFLEQVCADNDRRAKKVASGAMTLIMQHDWPGNVRELKNVVERLA